MITENIHDRLEATFTKLGFRKWPINDGFTKSWFIGTDQYFVKFEGCAYILYKQVTIYTTPASFLLNFIFRKKERENYRFTASHYEPILEFRTPEKLELFAKALFHNEGKYW